MTPDANPGSIEADTRANYIDSALEVIPIPIYLSLNNIELQ
jgi:hypothetical protein